MGDRLQASVRRRGDRGAVIIEAALVTPVLLLLVVGVIEWGLAFRDHLALQSAVAGGARMAAVAGSTATADWQVLEAVERELVGVPMAQVRAVVVFKADGPGAAVPPECKVASQLVGSTDDPLPGACNHYTAAELALEAMPESWGSCDATSPVRSYCPGGRRTSLDGDGPDYLGVYVEIDHPFVTRLPGDQLRLSATAVTKLEPTRFA